MYETTDEMYKTTDENDEGRNSSQKIEVKSLSGADSPSTENFILRMSAGRNFLRKQNDNMSSVDSAKELKGYCRTCVSLIIFFAIGTVFVLWVAALIIDRPVELHSCIILWPLVAGVLFIGAVFVILRCCERCLRWSWHRRNLRMAEQPILKKDSLVEGCPICTRSRAEPNSDAFIVYKQHTCIKLSYAFLGFALFCIMIACDIQFFTLRKNCYDHLRENMKELLLGYEILAYMGVFAFSIFGCLCTCTLFGIVIKCCTPD